MTNVNNHYVYIFETVCKLCIQYFFAVLAHSKFHFVRAAVDKIHYQTVTTKYCYKIKLRESLSINVLSESVSQSQVQSSL